MAKRRRVGNLLALAVLSTLMQQPMHPYEMASVLRERNKDADMKIKWGSFYTVVGNLEKHGLIAVAGSDRQGGRPERTVYAITDEGRAELLDWVSELIAHPEPEQPRFAAGLSVLSIIPPDQAIALLRERLAVTRHQIEYEATSLSQTAQEIPRLFLIETEYHLALRRAEAAWLAALLDELTDGSFPGLAAWRTFHETGRLPDDIAALARRGTED